MSGVEETERRIVHLLSECKIVGNADAVDALEAYTAALKAYGKAEAAFRRAEEAVERRAAELEAAFDTPALADAQGGGY